MRSSQIAPRLVIHLVLVARTPRNLDDDLDLHGVDHACSPTRAHLDPGGRSDEDTRLDGDRPPGPGRSSLHGCGAGDPPEALRLERRAGRGRHPTPRSSPRSRTSPRSAPTTAWCSSTRAARSGAGGARRRCAAGRDDRLDTAVFTHGHIDHCFGVELYEAEAARAAAGARRGSSRTRRSPPASTATVETAGYNGIINQRQFRSPRRRSGRPSTATPTRRTATASTSTSAASDSSCTTRAARPTTTPGSGCPDRRVLCTGDLFIWASPNCGNPQKVQRYAIEWARALRTMADARRRGAPPRPRPADRRRRPRPRRAHRHRRSCSSTCTPRRSA